MQSHLQYLFTLLDKRSEENNNQEKVGEFTSTCSDGGTMKTSVNIDSITKIGTIIYTYNKCLINGVEGNGQSTISVNKYDVISKLATDYAQTYTNFSQTYDGITVISNGSMQTIDELKSKSQLTFISNVTQKYSTGEQTLDNNFKVLITSSGDNLISGQICDANSGCVNITTPVAYFSSANGGAFSKGQSILTGSANSKIRLSAVNGLFWMDLDANGDGVYEVTTQYVR